MLTSIWTRRQFLSTSGMGGAAALGLGGCAASVPVQSVVAEGGSTVRAIGQPMPNGVELPASPPPRPTGDSVGYAIVGLGDFALKQIMPRIGQASRSHIAALVSGNPAKLTRVAEAYSVPETSRYSYEDFDRIADDAGVDAVYVILPTALHPVFTERAFAAGKHVLTEKPMALSSQDCARMIAAAERANRKLMVAYRCHFEPHNLAAMELMRDGALGELRLIRTQHAYRAGPTTPAENWRFNRAYAGGGPLEDYGIYGLQAALYLSGEMPETISALTLQPAGDPRFSEIFAQVSTQMRFPSGTVAQLSTSYDRNGTNTVEVRGTDGALIGNPATSYGGQEFQLLSRGEHSTLSPGDPEVQFPRMLDHFAAAIRDNTTVRTPGAMGLRDARLIEAIYASAAEGRMVRLDPDGTMRS